MKRRHGAETRSCRQCATSFVTVDLRRRHCSPECRAAFGRARIDKNEKRSYNKAYYASHRAYFDRHNKRYYEAHKDDEKARATAWQIAHPEQARTINRKAKARYRRTAKGKESAIRDAHRRRTVGKIAWRAWKQKLRRLGGACVSCGRTDDIQIDHILPVAKGGTNDIRNLQPLCRRCNVRKGAKVLAGTQLRLV